jgi:hypothetical protein
MKNRVLFTVVAKRLTFAAFLSFLILAGGVHAQNEQWPPSTQTTPGFLGPDGNFRRISDPGFKAKKSGKITPPADLKKLEPSESNGKSDEEAQDNESKPASNGSNPADLITRVELKYQFQNFAGGYLHGVPVIRGDYAFTPTVAFRMDLPILTFDSKTPGSPSQTGIGDIVTSMTFVKIFSKRFVGAFVPRIDFPTASYATLGSGKYSFKPTLAGITPLAPGLLFAGVAEYRVSFAGKQNRADINELSLKPILLKSFLKGPLKGYYVNPKLEVIVDFETNNRTTTQLGAEFGKALNKNVVIFAIPTFHIAGTKRETFKLEAGFRYLFR